MASRCLTCQSVLSLDDDAWKHRRQGHLIAAEYSPEERAERSAYLRGLAERAKEQGQHGAAHTFKLRADRLDAGLDDQFRWEDFGKEKT